MIRRRQWTWLWILILVALAASYALSWKVVHDRAVKALDAQVAAWRGQGYGVSWEKRTTGGFPLQVEAVFTGPAISSPSTGAPWSWTAETLRVRLHLWSLSEITVEPQGRQSLTAAGFAPLAGEADSLEVRLAADRLGPRRIIITADRLTLVDPASGHLLLTIDSIRAGADRNQRDPGSVRLTAAVTHPEWLEARGGDGPPAELTLDAQATAVNAFEASSGDSQTQGAVQKDVSDDVQTDARARGLAAWAAAGGALTVNAAAINWGDAEIGVRGSLRIDARGFWTGALTLDSRSPAQAFARLAGLGLLDPNTAQQVGAVAASAATSPDKPVELPLTLRDGHVYALGMLKIARVARAF
jgi:hypothetical protein